MDAGVVDEVDDGAVALLVLVAEVLSQVDEQLSAHRLVAVHVGHIFKLRLTCEGQKQHLSDYLSSRHTFVYSATHPFINLYEVVGTLESTWTTWCLFFVCFILSFTPPKTLITEEKTHSDLNTA